MYNDALGPHPELDAYERCEGDIDCSWELIGNHHDWRLEACCMLLHP